jgi:hypothetical protein
MNDLQKAARVRPLPPTNPPGGWPGAGRRPSAVVAARKLVERQGAGWVDELARQAQLGDVAAIACLFEIARGE